MKWTVLNAFGGLAWLAGLSVAKGTNLPNGISSAVGDHQLIVGLMFGVLGAAVLLWTNLRTAV